MLVASTRQRRSHRHVPRTQDHTEPAMSATPTILGQRPGAQKVNLEQLKYTIDYERAQIHLHENWIEAWIKRGEAERSYTRHVYYQTVLLGLRPDDPLRKQNPFLENYHQAHKAQFEAEVEIRKLQLAQFKAQLMIHEAMFKEAENPLFTARSTPS